MKNRSERRGSLSLVSAALVVGLGASIGLSLRPVLIVSAVVALAVLVGIIWRARARAAGRRIAALEAYANREIARVRDRRATVREKPRPPAQVAPSIIRGPLMPLVGSEMRLYPAPRRAQAKRTPSRRNSHAGPQSQGR